MSTERSEMPATYAHSILEPLLKAASPQPAISDLLETMRQLQRSLIITTPSLIPTSTSSPRRYVPVSIDEFGNHTFAGQPVLSIHSQNSQAGRLLQYFESNRDRLVTRREIESSLGAGANEREVRKRLNKQLRELGYEIDGTWHRGSGYIYRGITDLL